MLVRADPACVGIVPPPQQILASGASLFRIRAVRYPYAWMSRLSSDEVDTLRSWFVLTKAMYATSEIRVPKRPLRWMVLVYLAIQPDGSASYTELRNACDLDVAPKLSQVTKPLEAKGYVTKHAGGSGARLTLDKPGWDVIEQKILKALSDASRVNVILTVARE